MSERATQDSQPHVCDPAYVAEGEYVCFDCGAYYAFHGVYDSETLAECRAVIDSRASSPQSGEVR